MVRSEIDVIVFGATGFTGKYVVEECVKLKNITWAVAGRNVIKMRQLLDKISLKCGTDLSDIVVVEAHCDNPDSLNKMAAVAKLVINCTGPYRFYGESVVKACVETGTDYVDITGEPEFMERMQLEYHDLAATNGCYIINSCGMDSVPIDVGIVHFSKQFEGQVNYVETYMKLNTSSNGPFINYTTWECAVHGFANQKMLGDIRKRLFSQWRSPRPQPSIPRRPTVHRCPHFDDKRCILFPGSDRSVAVRTQMFLANEYDHRPIQCNAYSVCDSIFTLWGLTVVGYFMKLLTKYEFGKKLLLKYPRLFSLGMSSDRNSSLENKDVTLNTTTIFKFYGEGWSPQTLHKYENEGAKTITEPTNAAMLTTMELKNAAYGFTSMCVIQCALVVLREKDKLPSKGGVYMPGFAFYRTSLIERLAERGAEFKILRKFPK